jgi:hypothetical protein
MMEALISPETSVITRATRRNIPEDHILQGTWNLLGNDRHYQMPTMGMWKQLLPKKAQYLYALKFGPALSAAAIVSSSYYPVLVQPSVHKELSLLLQKP